VAAFTLIELLTVIAIMGILAIECGLLTPPFGLLVFTVKATDGTEHDITITVNGADDPSQITLGAGDSDAEAVTEDVGVTSGNLQTSGTLTVTDADTSDVATV